MTRYISENYGVARASARWPLSTILRIDEHWWNKRANNISKKYKEQNNSSLISKIIRERTNSRTRTSSCQNSRCSHTSQNSDKKIFRCTRNHKKNKSKDSMFFLRKNLKSKNKKRFARYVLN